jgi:PAS domain S-box-containing protein
MWTPFLALGLAVAAGSLLLPLPTQRQAMGCFALVAAAAVLAGAQGSRPATLRGWRLLACGLAAGGIGFLVQAHGQTNVAGNVCWIATVVLVLAAMVYFGWNRSVGARGPALVDAAILAAAAALLNWLFAFQPVVAAHFKHAGTEASYLINPGLDTILYLAVGAVLFGPASLTAAYRLLAGSFVTLLAAGTIARQGLFHKGTPYERAGYTVWIVCFALAGAAALHPSLSPRALRRRPGSGLTWQRVAALGIALLAAPLAMLADSLTGKRVESLDVGVGGAVIALLALWRLVDLVLRHERVRAGAEHSEQRFRELVEHLEPVVIESVGSAERPLFVSRRAEDLLGYPLWRWLESGSFFVDHVHPDDRERVAARQEDSLRNRRDYEHEYRMLTADGRVIWVRSSARLRADEATGEVRISSILSDVTEEKLGQDKLERSLALFRATLDSTADGILVVDSNGGIAGYNRKFVEMWNIPESVLSPALDNQALAYVLDQLVDPDAFVEKVRELYSEPDAESFDVVEFKDGRRFERYSKPQKISRESVGRVWSFRDVTVRKRAEEALRESERSFRETLENVHLVALALDTSGTVTFCNDYLLELGGWTRAELVGRPWFPLALAHEPASERLFVRALHEGTLPTHFEQALSTRSGELRLISWNVTTLRDAQGAATGIVSIGEDITEARHAEEALRESEERFRSLIENASDVITILDGNGVIRYASPSIERVLGYVPEELVGRSVRELVDMEDMDTTREWLVALRDGGGDVVEIRTRTADGDWRVLEAVGKVLVDGPDGREIVVNARDVTERRQAEEALQASEEQLRQAQKMEAVGRLAGGVAHDFNNLLTAISGYSEFLIAQLDSESPLRHDAVEIQKAAERAAALTRQLLAFSRRQVLQPKVLDLNDVVADVSRLLRRLIGEDVQLAVHPATDLGQVKADPGQLEQVLVNLAVNARDAMPSGGELVIRTANLVLTSPLSGAGGELEAGRYVTLTVGDTGAGIDTSTREHLFEPFFTTKEQGKGTGLGLATVFGIVKQSGGDILVTSEPGSGAEFTIVLPRVDAPAALRAVEGNGNGNGHGNGHASPAGGAETVLLVEDEQVVRRLVRDVLERSGYEVLEAQDGATALELCSGHEGEIDLLLTDVVMPQMSGRELAEQLTGSRPGLRVLYTSGYTDGEIDEDGALDAGVSFVGKPFSPDELARKVRELLDKPAA